MNTDFARGFRNILKQLQDPKLRVSGHGESVTARDRRWLSVSMDHEQMHGDLARQFYKKRTSSRSIATRTIRKTTRLSLQVNADARKR